MSLSIGERLRQARGSIGVAGFAAALGVNRKTVTRWESGDSIPDGASLLALKEQFDVDPSWLLTGKGAGLELSEDERELLALYRAAPLAGKAAAVGALKVVVASGNNVVVTGDGNRVAGGNVHRGGKKRE